ncbi:MAG: alpha/beta hydrolase [Opitutus sp.]|nr:alpha/beta hydrolase [Opitutus sp.]
MITSTVGANKRALHRLASLVYGLATFATAFGAQSAPTPGTKTYVYKRVGSLEIKADVLPAPKFAGLRPVVVWIHGGALINGNRERDFYEENGGWLGQLHAKHGVVLITIDYRLAPETPLPAIIGDIEDAFRWVREKGPELFHADPARIAVTGSSAGGYLSLVTGFRVRPAPVAIVSLWGYGDLVGAWYTEPSPHARHHELNPTAAEAWRQVSGPAIANAADRKGNGSAFYQYTRQHGIWPWAVSGLNPWLNPAAFYPFMPLQHVTPAFPPTLLVHGQSDTDVPHELSVLMAAEFRRHGVEHGFISIPGAEHGLREAEPKVIDKAYRDAAEFLARHLRLVSPQAP